MTVPWTITFIATVVLLILFGNQTSELQVFAQSAGVLPKILPSTWNIVDGLIFILAFVILVLAMVMFIRKVLSLRNSRTEVRRLFSQSAIQRVSNLTQNHYAMLAHVAGVLARLLDDYLLTRFNHLLLIYQDSSSLQLRLDQIADESAKDSFFYFCQLIYCFDSFQKNGCNTYLLTSHVAGETLSRLYNAFVGNIPQGTSVSAIDSYKIIQVLGHRMLDESTPSEDVTSISLFLVKDFPIKDFMEKVLLGKLLKTEFQAYKNWLLHASSDIVTATEALKGYSTLLNHELALIHQHWSGEKPITPESSARKMVSYTRSTGVSTAVFEAAVKESPFPRPLASVTPASTSLSPEGAEQTKRRGKPDQDTPSRRPSKEKRDREPRLSISEWERIWKTSRYLPPTYHIGDNVQRDKAESEIAYGGKTEQKTDNSLATQ